MSTRTGRRSLENLSFVTEYLSQIIEQSGRSQSEIAENLGYRRSAIVSMWKSGATALPIDRVEPLAALCGADPVELMRVVLGGYYPVLLDFIERHPELSEIPGKYSLNEVCR